MKFRVLFRFWFYTFSHETLQFRKKNSVKNYIHSSLVLDQKLSGKGILRLYCLSHACHSKMSVFRCLSDLSVQIVRRSTLNRLEFHFRVQGSYKTSSNSKSSVMSCTNSVTILPILYFPRQDWVEGGGGGGGCPKNLYDMRGYLKKIASLKNIL